MKYIQTSIEVTPACRNKENSLSLIAIFLLEFVFKSKSEEVGYEESQRLLKYALLWLEATI